jgi:predicted SprT family Zn-dependent metalloprotease
MLQSELFSYARDLMREHGLQGWRVIPFHSRSNAGECRYGTNTIALSIPLLVNGNASEADCRNTILHEIAHALVGAGHRHDHVWHQQFVSIGGNGTEKHSIKTAHRYTGVCKCGKSFHRDARSDKMFRLMCRACRGTIVWTDTKTHEVLNAPHPAVTRTPSALDQHIIAALKRAQANRTVERPRVPSGAPALCGKCFTMKSVSGDCLC